MGSFLDRRRRRRYPYWSWQRGGSPRPRLYVEVNLWPMNRPHLSGGWSDERTLNYGLSWGNGNSDPVWLVDVELTVPERIGVVVDRYYAQRRGACQIIEAEDHGKD